MKLYVKERIPGKRPIYYPSVLGITFDDMPFTTATEADKMGGDLLKAVLDDPDLVFEWEEKYAPSEEQLELVKTPFHKRVAGDS